MRVIRRGRFRGIPEEADAAGEVQLVMVGAEVWLRFFKVNVFNNHSQSMLCVYMYASAVATQTVELGPRTVQVQLPGTTSGGVEVGMPDEIQMPMDNVRTRSGRRVDHAAFRSFIIVRKGMRAADGTLVPHTIQAMAELEDVQLTNLAFNARVAANIQTAVKQLDELQNTAGGAVSILGKSYGDMAAVARNAFTSLDHDMEDDLNFNEFKVVCKSLGLRATESRMWQWFVMGDLDRSGSMDVGELQFSLFCISKFRPARYVKPRDVFLMFDMDSKDPNHQEKPGTIDIIGFYEVMKVFNKSITQKAAEALFAEADMARQHRISYPQFLRAWVKGAPLGNELKRRGLKKSEVMATAAPAAGETQAEREAAEQRGLQQAVLRLVHKEDELDMDEYKRVVEEAHRVRMKARGDRFMKKRAKEVAVERESKAERRTRMLQERRRQAAAKIAAQEEAERAARERKLFDTLERDRIDRQKAELAAARAESRRQEQREQQRRAELRLDRMDMASKNLQHMPATLWTDPRSAELLPHVLLLNASHNQIRLLPSNCLFKHMASLRKLDVSSNLLTELPEDAQYLRSLLIFNAGANRLTSLRATLFDHMASLRVLDLHRNGLTSLPAGIGKLAMLERCNLQSNPLTALPSEIGQCAALQELRIDGCPIEWLPDELCGCTAMVELSARSCGLQAVPRALGMMKRLQRLYLDRNDLQFLPESLGFCRHMQELSVSHCRLKDLPFALKGMNYLLELNVSHNQLKQVPPCLGDLASVLRVDLSHNQIAQVHPFVGRMRELQLWDLSHNQVSSLPPDVAACSNLRELNLSHNRFGAEGHSGLPPSFPSLYSLRVLDMAHNQLTVLPVHLGGVQTLTHLTLDHNQLSEMPTFLCSLEQLVVLDMSFNQLARMPEQIVKLQALRALDVSCNLLRQLPAAVGSLASLRHFHAFNNRLRRVPLSMAGLAPRLSTLDLSRNPFQELPKKRATDEVLGANGLDARFSKPCSQANFLEDVREGLDRTAKQQLRLESDAFDDWQDEQRTLMEAEDTRAAQWRAKGINTRLLAAAKRRAWQPVDTRAEYLQGTPFSPDPAAEVEPDRSLLPAGIDDWFAVRADVERHARFVRLEAAREEARAERAARKVAARAAKAAETDEAKAAKAKEALQARIMRVMQGLATAEDEAGAASDASTDSEVLRQRDAELAAKYSWTDEDARWAKRIYDREPAPRAKPIAGKPAPALLVPGPIADPRAQPASSSASPTQPGSAHPAGSVPQPGTRAGSARASPKPSSTAQAREPVELLARMAGLAPTPLAAMAEHEGVPAASESKRELGRLADLTHGEQRLAAQLLDIPTSVVLEFGQDRLQRQQARAAGTATDANAKYTADKHFIAADRTRGYTTAQVAEWVRVQAILYDACHAEWKACGGAAMERQISPDEFEAAVRRRLGTEWEVEFGEAVRWFFHESRNNGGVAPMLEPLPEAVDAARAQRVTAGQQLTKAHHQRVKARLDGIWQAFLGSYEVDRSDLAARKIRQDMHAKAHQKQTYVAWLRATLHAAKKAEHRQVLNALAKHKAARQRSADDVKRLNAHVRRSGLEKARRAREQAQLAQARRARLLAMSRPDDHVPGSPILASAPASPSLPADAAEGAGAQASASHPTPSVDLQASVRSLLSAAAAQALPAAPSPSAERVTASDNVSEDGDFELDDLERERQGRVGRLRPDSAGSVDSLADFAQSYLSNAERAALGLPHQTAPKQPDYARESVLAQASVATAGEERPAQSQSPVRQAEAMAVLNPRSSVRWAARQVMLGTAVAARVLRVPVLTADRPLMASMLKRGIAPQDSSIEEEQLRTASSFAFSEVR